MKHLLVAIGLGLATPAWAQQVNVLIDPDLAAEAGVDAAEVQAQIRAATQDSLKLDGPEVFLGQMAAANAFATKGMGVDYASNPQRFFVGGTLGTAVNGAGFTFVHGEDTLPTAGFAFQAAANAGLNLGFLAEDESFLRRFVISANGLWAKGASGPLDAELYNVGGHVQVKLIRPPHKGVVEWGGLDLTTGYEVSSYRLILSDTLPIETDGLRWDATGTFDVTALSHTIPVELSTNLRVFVFSVYGGAGLDIRRSAIATGELGLAGPLTASAQGQEMKIGTVDVSYTTESSAPSDYVPRVFAGAQINVLFVKIYGHLNVAFDDTYGGSLGLRVAL